ncbi:hypothetical protein [Anaerotruncus massiliensis (ex Liu et al. 2021)]|uniref:hypothetical protein n=1 Tax=Anaerotruncus massiliensis (ex Liu et al. 2021) TaxID=2321404 RepID=UPI003AB759D0
MALKSPISTVGSALLVEALHIAEDDTDAQRAGDAADVVEVGVEDADRTPEILEVDLRDGADAREDGVIGAREVLGLLGEPEGLDQIHLGAVVFDDDVAVLVALGPDARIAAEAEDAVVDVEQAADVLAHIWEQLLHADDRRAALADVLRGEGAPFRPFMRAVQREAEVPLEVEGDHADQIVAVHAITCIRSSVVYCNTLV